MSELIITNGDSVAGSLRQIRPQTQILPWRDALHEGPVRAVSASQFRELRALWLADGTVHTYADVLAELEERDRIVADHTQFERIELWFEHDLYDQLQLIQALDMLSAAGWYENIVLIQAPRHLGPVEPAGLKQFEELALPVGDAMIETASSVWSAFRCAEPTALAKVRTGPLPGFVFLGHAIRRMLQELPGSDGLGRTERQILYSLGRGVGRVGPVFARVSNMEEAAYLGDWGFFRILTALHFTDVPMLTGLPEPFEPAVLEDDTRRKAFITANLELTTLGSDILAGTADRLDHNAIDVWIGGTHVTPDNLWRWDDEAEQLIAPR